MRERGRTNRQSPDVLNTLQGHPLAYLITFTTYGTWVHGDERGSVDRNHRSVDEDRLQPDAGRERTVRAALRSQVLVLDERMRVTIEDAIREVCEQRAWRLDAINVRTNHVHVVVGARIEPERVMTAFKAWATRRCRELRVVDSSQRMWTRHGSTRYLWREIDVGAAVDYVLNRQ